MHSDIMGFNYYYNCQWEHRGAPIPWPDPEQTISRKVPFSTLLRRGYERYGKPVVVSETGHFDALRAQWIREISVECLEAIAMGVDLRGICIYPIIERPD